jgi:hypothetical protein
VTLLPQVPLAVTSAAWASVGSSAAQTTTNANAIKNFHNCFILSPPIITFKMLFAFSAKQFSPPASFTVA